MKFNARSKKIIATVVFLFFSLIFVQVGSVDAACIAKIVPKDNSAMQIQTKILHKFRDYVLVCTRVEYKELIRSKKYFSLIVFPDVIGNNKVYCIDPSEMPQTSRDQFLFLVGQEINASNLPRVIVIVVIPLFLLSILAFSNNKRFTNLKKR